MNNPLYQWAVIGAGPAGIAAVGKLLDHCIKPETILWIDPYFQVGDLGRFWGGVCSNTSVSRFIDFLKSPQAFAYDERSTDFDLNHLEPESTCTLQDVAVPLQSITEKLCTQVQAIKTQAQHINLKNNIWSIDCGKQLYQAKNVILATGAEPQSLHSYSIPSIPFTTAMNQEQLRQCVDANGTYAVFGSSHSAVLVLNYLVNLGVKKIINFYRSPCRYALDMNDWILFDNTGLKGHAALWARENLDGVWPENLTRYIASEDNINRYLPQCDQAIYAVGFKRRNTLSIGGFSDVSHNSKVGIIAPGLFGLGIAYPETKSDPLGNVEEQVGLWKFMCYLNKIMPIWLQYHS